MKKGARFWSTVRMWSRKSILKPLPSGSFGTGIRASFIENGGIFSGRGCGKHFYSVRKRICHTSLQASARNKIDKSEIYFMER